MNEKVLAVRDVTKVFDEGRQRVHVLKGITMDVAQGEVVALEGPSGSGKTTLLSIMGCILTPSSGELEVAGRRVGAADAARQLAQHAHAVGVAEEAPETCGSLVHGPVAAHPREIGKRVVVALGVGSGRVVPVPGRLGLVGTSGLGHRVDSGARPRSLTPDVSARRGARR
jgi:hypothetical protein